MSKFKASTQQLINQTVQELLQPKIEPGKMYCFQTMKGIVIRQVIEVTKNTVRYTKPNGAECTCSLKTFRRLYAEHGVTPKENER